MEGRRAPRNGKTNLLSRENSETEADFFSTRNTFAGIKTRGIQDAKWPQWPSCQGNHLETGNDDVSKMHGKACHAQFMP